MTTTNKHIQLQSIGGYLYPTSSTSAATLRNVFNTERIPGNKFYMWSARIVAAGYAMAITGELDDIK